MARAYTGMAGIARVTDPIIRSALATVDTFLRDNSRATSPTNNPTTVGVGSAPDDVKFVTIGTDTRLSAERKLLASSPLLLTDNGANSSAVISLTTATLAATLTAVPALSFSTGNATGAATTFVQTDATVALFDATAPAALAGTAAAGTVAFAARRDHVHLYPIALRSTANASTLTLTDDATNQTLTGSLGYTIIQPSTHIALTLDSGLTKLVSVGGGVLAGSKLSLNIASSTNQSAAIRAVVTCNANSLTYYSFRTDLQTHSNSGLGTGSTLRGNSANIVCRGINKTINAETFKADATFSTDDATSIMGYYYGFYATTPTRASAATITNYAGINVQPLPTWVTNGWGGYFQERVEVQSQSARATTALLILQKATGTATGAHINFDDKAGDAAAPVAGDLWRNGAALRWYDGTNTLQMMQQATTGTTTGFTAGAGTAVLHDSTFTGNSGATAYTIGDIVLALKNNGALAA